MKSAFLVIACLVFSLPANGQSANKTDDSIEAIHLGVITKMDKKKNNLTISEPRDLGPIRGVSGGRGRGGGGGSRGGRGGGGGRTSSGGGGAATANSSQIETKVPYTGETVVKEAGRQIAVQELRVGDFVRITEHIQGKKYEAKEIERLPGPPKG